ncbi:low quality protein: polyserase-2 [Lynx pardinus]|uniref:Low quality protein: polyserase-2 n=1 Tax=Lynx pardinus TaxID=191816 RepID=A0A485NYZ9_LYNPA|nr:low quality protein: polyserase-2 [Lynx pardinus]
MAHRAGLGLRQLEAVAILLLLGLFRSGLAFCGVASQARITGGSSAAAGQWPWQVSITYDGTHACGGSLVSEQWVLSAAHCFPREHVKEDYEVKLGAHQLDSYTPEAEVRTVAQVISHSSYHQEGSQGDIALLRLSSPVTFSRYIRPICLPAANASFPNGLQCTVTGWGHVAPSVSLLAPRQLQQLEVPLISRETCNCLYNIDAKPEEPHFIQQDMLCAGYVKGGKDACQSSSLVWCPKSRSLSPMAIFVSTTRPSTLPQPRPYWGSSFCCH